MKKGGREVVMREIVKVAQKWQDVEKVEQSFQVIRS